MRRLVSTGVLRRARLAHGGQCVGIPLHNSARLLMHCTYACRKDSPPAAAGHDHSGSRTTVKYSKMGMDGFTDVRFNTRTDEFLENTESAIDCMNHPEVDSVQCSGGVLTLETVNHGTYILNKQAPNLQLWLSSPISGPHHYDMEVTEHRDPNGVIFKEDIRWVCDKSGRDLQTLLESELSDVLKVPVHLSPVVNC